MNDGNNDMGPINSWHNTILRRANPYLFFIDGAEIGAMNIVTSGGVLTMEHVVIAKNKNFWITDTYVEASKIYLFGGTWTTSSTKAMMLRVAEGGDWELELFSSSMSSSSPES